MEPTNKEIFIEYINGSSIKQLTEKYNFNTSVIEAMVSYGREEHNNTEYWNTYLKPILKK